MKTFLTGFLLPLLVAAAAGLVALAYYDVKLFLDIALWVIAILTTITLFGLGWSLGIAVLVLHLKVALPDSQKAVDATADRLGAPWWTFAATFVAMAVVGVGTIVVEHRMEEMRQDLEEKQALADKLEAQIEAKTREP